MLVFSAREVNTMAAAQVSKTAAIIENLFMAVPPKTPGNQLIPSLSLRVLTRRFQFTPLNLKRGTVARAPGNAMLGLGHAAVGSNRLLRFAAPAVIAAIKIVLRLSWQRGAHKEFLRAQRSAERTSQDFAGFFERFGIN